ncbi:hypothetical protein GlitD10_2552 [Gloeomargarita lithophora Alchichica-D10]|uniref:Uncharacterized protein n=1 Tax=Gloeomargarita lithophora Alchichica-D10 TaxID=1188229 RepID=A0A1J0AG22_9CYAN|nr:hypothetical protein [Gloeomargarita lithophora]APB34890.1 hypothetical protein GlitD10_2552 [Gloeomargarita lithophora Alchichica-D10]
MQSNAPTTLETLAATLEAVVHRLNSIDTRLDKLEIDQRETKEQVSRVRFEMETSQKTGERLERLATSFIVGATIAVMAGVVLIIIRGGG